MPIAILTLLAPIFSALINKIFPDPVEAAKAQADVQTALNQAMSIQLDAQAKMQASVGQIANTRAGSSSRFVSWCTPLLMYVFTAIIALNYLLSPLLGAIGVTVPVLAIPANMWDLLMVFTGVYGLGTSAVKATEHFSNKKFYDAYRKQFGSVDQATVEKLNQAIQEGQSQ
jgi:hypothetical protein